MTPRFAVQEPLEEAYVRKVLLAVELLDAVTLERVTGDVEVTAKGLAARAIVNASGLFVWTEGSDAAKFDGLVIEPRTAPYERREFRKIDVTLPFFRVQLNPLPNYPFNAGDTAIRGRLVESNGMAPEVPRVPIVNAIVRFEWRDDDGNWHPWQAPRVTGPAGDFTAMVRLERGRMNEDVVPGDLTVRMRARRATGEQKQIPYQLPQGRVVDKTFAWDDPQ